MSKFSGGCRCGDVRYDIDVEPFDVKICHCRDCQYASGGAFSVIAYFPAAACNLTGKTTGYEVKGSAGMSVDRNFCPRCGTPVFSALKEMPDVIFVKVGTLDHPETVKPSGHLWCRSMLPWADINDGLERLPGNPQL